MLVHNETDTLEKLLKFLVKWKQPQDEIVILDDYSDDEMEEMNQVITQVVIGDELNT